MKSEAEEDTAPTATMDIEPFRPMAGSGYNIYQRLTSKGWAWEFLRRNADFRRDWRSFRIEPTADTVITIDADRHSRYLEKWGLIFRRCSHIRRLCGARGLGAGAYE
jgi:hypothetical protein